MKHRIIYYPKPLGNETKEDIVIEGATRFQALNFFSKWYPKLIIKDIK